MCAKYYELRCVFYKKKLHLSKLARLLDRASKFALFSASGLKDKKLIKRKPTRKLKHANSILEYFEYFFQISSKSIFIILSYTVSKSAHFLRHSVDTHNDLVSCSRAQLGTSLASGISWTNETTVTTSR